MAKLKYFRYGDTFLISHITDGERGKLTVSLGTSVFGKLVFGTHVSDIKDGECTLDLNAFPDGKNELYLLENRRKLPLEAFEKRGEIISAPPPAEQLVRGLLEKQITTEERISELEALCKRLSDKIAHTTIF